GVGAMVHYGVTMGDGSVLAPDSFLMKGEEVPARARWGGNPAREMGHDNDQPARPARPGEAKPGGEKPGVLARRAAGRRVHGRPAVDARPSARYRRARGRDPRRPGRGAAPARR